MTQHSHDIIEQLAAKLDEKIEEIARSSDVAALVETQLGPQTAQTIQAYNEGFAQADQYFARRVDSADEERAGSDTCASISRDLS